MIYESILELVGNTPIVHLKRIEEKNEIKGNLYAKVEGLNPARSAKDRVGLNMILDAEEKGLLKPGATIIEPTSGNTGIGIAMAGAVKGYKVILTMPDTMSEERIKLIKAYGAEVVLTDGKLGMKGAIEKAEELKSKTEGSWIAGQFDNPSNWEAHYKTTGPEIYESMDKKIDYFVAGIGTGGTITGVARYLKEKDKDIKVIGFEPVTSPMITEGHSGPHNLQGIGANFIPSILDLDVIDEVLTISNEEAYKYGKELADTEGILSGITAGAAVACAVKLTERYDLEGKNIVVLLPDSGEKYLSTEMFR